MGCAAAPAGRASVLREGGQLPPQLSQVGVRGQPRVVEPQFVGLGHGQPGGVTAHAGHHRQVGRAEHPGRGLGHRREDVADRPRTAARQHQAVHQAVQPLDGHPGVRTEPVRGRVGVQEHPEPGPGRFPDRPDAAPLEAAGALGAVVQGQPRQIRAEQPLNS